MVIELEGIKKKAEISVTEIYTLLYYEFSNDYYFAGEKHNFWEIIYVDKGSVTVVIENKCYHLDQNELIFCEPNAFHKAYADTDASPNLFVLTFSCSDEIIRFFQRQVLQLNHEERYILGQIIAVVCNGEKVDYVNRMILDPSKSVLGFGTNQLLFLYVELFILHLLRRNASVFYKEFYPSLSVRSVKSKSHDGRGADQFNAIVKYFEENLHRNIHLDEVCREFSISSSSLRRLFQRHCEKSVIAYFNYLKIQKAKEMIREQKMSYSQIAESLGYASIHYFSKQFKHVSGMTPSQYIASVKFHSDFRLLDEDMDESSSN